jgi:phosphoribosylcarboxyaminoimidazole (NCAIR) mutase
MTIVRSLGVTALVALMSAHRASTEQCNIARPFEQADVDAIEAYLRRIEDPKR